MALYYTWFLIKRQIIDTKEMMNLNVRYAGGAPFWKAKSLFAQCESFLISVYYDNTKLCLYSMQFILEVLRSTYHNKNKTAASCETAVLMQ